MVATLALDGTASRGGIRLPRHLPFKDPEDRYMCICQPETAAGRWEGGHLAEVKCLLTDQQGRQLEASPPTPRMEAKQVHTGDR